MPAPGFTQFLRLLEAVGNFEHPLLWSAVMLFLVLFLMLNALYVIMLNICSSIEDAAGAYGSKCCFRILITFAVCTICFLTSMGYTTQSGYYGLNLVDSFLDLLSPWTIVTFEIVAIAWFYCAHLLAVDMKQMIENRFWKVLAFPLYEILYIIPVVPVYILVIKLSNYDLNEMVGHTSQWVEAVGWLICLTTILPILGYMVFCVVRTFINGPGLTCMEKLKYTITSPLRHETVKPASNSRYTSTAPGYVLLQQAPLAEAEQFNELYNDNTTKISHI
ncbi:unnamed protein product [Soboliphyme baturini]|uniref:Sodium-and chloride-dependent glycine transporter 2 n=1 Tax=Soboliphyme baturini TaxID=241478 RepID=A0A183IED7_9BILA|nr:unnamed protein product [Soboliphyme baturini]